MAPQVSRSEFPWSSPVVIVTSGEEGAKEGAATDNICFPASSKKGLIKALDECQKREDAVRKVFIICHEKMQELAAKKLLLEQKELELKETEAQQNLERKRLGEAQSPRSNTNLSDSDEELDDTGPANLDKGEEHTTPDLKQENAALRKASEEFSKRENAIRQVFILAHTRNQQLYDKVRKLEVLELESKRTKELLNPMKTMTRKKLAAYANADLMDRIRELKKLLEEYEKRQSIFLEVSVQMRQREQALSKKQNNIDRIAEKLRAKENNLAIERQGLEKKRNMVNKRLAEMRNALTSHEDLAKIWEKEVSVAGREHHILLMRAAADARARKIQDTEKITEEAKAIADKYVAEQMTLMGIWDAQIKEAVAKTKNDNIASLITNTKMGAADHTPHFYAGDSKDLFLSEGFSNYDRYISPDGRMMRSKKMIHRMRRHDYYKGWLDAKKTEDAEDAFNKGFLGEEDAKYLQDADDHRSPVNAGCNVGAMFAWSALCAAHGERDKDIRLDGRQWKLSDLEPWTGAQSKGFWTGVRMGVEHATEVFMEKKKSGGWEKQTEFLV
ncbi:hypothetical protein P171DRAFT_131731 [Karstenula rhodostoma CBS 690.94]|uniref:Uncharacterized protein n=1 Tax=Karstenula rhodostoma CBS 690.94 TaxID=1392251 RepID=A0A9P4U7K0_9PLEO|nr:hypothetical protein P171DRAFT_131731 [Karstenula rhodostoma CBS 690.94]